MSLRVRLLVTLLPLMTLFVIGLTWFHSEVLVDEPPEQKMLLLGLSFVAFILIVGALFVVARNISRPIEELKDSALEIAAGDYGHPISVKGAREVVELAGVLDTMRECLHDHISRWKDHSRMLERRHGEYECAVLLQRHMLNQPIEKFHHDKISLKLIQGGSVRVGHGSFLRIDEEENQTEFSLFEALDPGFSGIYSMLTEPELLGENASSIQITYDSEEDRVEIVNHGMPDPLVWSTKKQVFLPSNQKIYFVEPGDLIFLRNRGFLSLFSSQDRIEQILTRVLKHFGKEDPETWQRIVSNELVFLSSRNRVAEGVHLLSFRFTKPRYFKPEEGDL